MKQGTHLLIASLCSLFSIAVYACIHAPGSPHSPAPMIYVASTPCSEGTKPVPGIPKDAPCEFIKWELKLFRNPEQQTGGNYILDCDYGMAKQGTQGFINGGTHMQRKGQWTSLQGKHNIASIIYRLDPDTPQASISFLRLNDQVLHLLDSDQQLMIGTGGFSYTLNKIK